jgi:RHS repeat-associated protein
MKRSRPLILALSAALCVLAPVVAADLPGSKDDPYVKRFDGSEIVDYKARNFDRLNFFEQADLTKPTALEGELVRIGYRLAPATQASSLEVFRNYEDELKSKGFQIINSGALSDLKLDTGFSYDAMGRRINILEKNSSGTVTSTKQLVWDGSGLVEERTGSNAVTKRFFAQGEQQSGADYYYTTDHLGSTREMCSSSGTIVGRYGYDAFGRTTLASGSNLATFQYTGDYYHLVSGLNLTKFRAYDPNSARWLSRDPLKNAERFQGPNLYEYVRDNPISYYDSLGTCTCEEAAVEKDAIITEANLWQTFENPPYLPTSFGNDCGTQANNLMDDLATKFGNGSCWSFQIDYGERAFAWPWLRIFTGSHNVVEVDPPFKHCCKGLHPFTLNPFGGNWNILSAEPNGPPTQSTPANFYSQFPMPYYNFFTGYSSFGS